MNAVKNKIRIVDSVEARDALNYVGCPLDVIGLEGTPVKKDKDCIFDGKPPQQEFEFNPYPSSMPYRWWVPVSLARKSVVKE